MFYLLSVTLCCAVLFMVFAVTSVICMWLGRLARPAFSALVPATVANLLFTIRILPVVLASLATFGFVLPALLRFEPRSTSEFVGWPLGGLAILGAVVVSMMLVRAATIVRSTSIVGATWHRHSKKLLVENINVTVYCLDNFGSVLAVMGFLRPKIFVARHIVDSLTPAELMAAVEHERAHVSSFDNLKQLILKVTRIPRWPGVFGRADSAWTNASEIAADEAALGSGISVLDLSSALIKVASLSTHAVVGNTVAASHLIPIESGYHLRARVDHLQEILQDDSLLPKVIRRNRIGKIILPLALAAIAYSACVGPVLPWVHEALEALVR